jgi:hypothetical protein
MHDALFSFQVESLATFVYLLKRCGGKAAREQARRTTIQN